MNSHRFAWRQIRREWKSGELRALAASLLVAVSAMTAVASFTDRVERAILHSANELLAADLVLSSRAPLDSTYTEKAHNLGLETADIMMFPSVVFTADASQLAAIKAVSQRYPLRGELKVSQDPFSALTPAVGLPQPGEAWADSQLMAALQLQVGDDILLGSISLKISQVLRFEPDRGGEVFNIAPRLMVHVDDVGRAELVGPGSRVSYRLLLAAEESVLTKYRQWIKPRLVNGERLLGVKENRRELEAALNRSSAFLNLAALTAVLLSGIAIIIAANRFARRHWDIVAMLRALGAKQRSIVMSFLLQLLYLAIPCSLLACGIGYFAQLILVRIAGSLAPQALPQATVMPLLIGLLVGVIMLVGFALPPLLRLGKIAPMRVLNKNLGPSSQRDIWRYLLPATASLGLVWWQAADVKMASIMIGGASITGVALALGAYVLIRFLRGVGSNLGHSWRYGLASVSRRVGSSMIQISGLGLGIMVILLLASVRTDLLASWKNTLDEDAPNNFLINIQEEQRDTISDYLLEKGLTSLEFYPIAVAKIQSINNQPVSADDYDNERTKRRVNGTVNLSWSQQLPKGNELIEGEWWTSERPVVEISLANSFAERFNLKLGDSVGFRIGSKYINAKVSSIRKVDWDSFNANFFIMLSPGGLSDVARTYIASTYVNPDQSLVLGELVRKMPNISVIDIGALLAKVTDIMDRASLAIEFVFLFTLLAGGLVLYSALQSTQDERRYETAILRTLGSSTASLRSASLVEFFILGSVSTTLATMGSWGTGKLLAEQVFKIDYHVGMGMLLGALIAVSLITLAGYWLSRSVLTTPPVIVLRGG